MKPASANIHLLALVLVTAAISSCAISGASQLQPPANATSLQLTGPAQQGRGSPQFFNGIAALMGLPAFRRSVDILLQTFRGLSPGGPFQEFLDLAQNASAQYTLFWPQASTWPELSSLLCLTLPQIGNISASAPWAAVVYGKLSIVPNKTVFRADFKEGLTLKTMLPEFDLTLSKRVLAGKPQWYFSGVAFNRTDVHIVGDEVTAGSAVVHFLDAAMFDEESRIFWGQQRDIAAERGCPDSTTATEPGGVGPQPLGPGIVAAIIISSILVVAAVLLLAVLLLNHKKLVPPCMRRLSPGKARKPHTVGESRLPIHLGDKDPAIRPPAASGGVECLQIPQIQPPNTPAARTPLFCSESATADSEASRSRPVPPSESWSCEHEEAPMAPVFRANPALPSAKLEAWLRQCALGVSSGSDASGSCSNSLGVSNSSGSNERAVFAEQLRRDLHPIVGNPHIINNYTNFTLEVEHSSTAVYFCEGMHNNRQFALKLYAQPEDYKVEMRAYQELGGPESRFVPLLEMSYPGTEAYPTSVLVFERGQCTLETFARQRPTYFQQIDIFYQIVSAVQHLHDHGVVHRDMKPSNVVHFPAQFAWKLIDLATTARVGEHAKIVYTRDYCSPEVAQAIVRGAVSMVVEPACDLWGVGVIMYELATGQRYFTSEWTVDGGGRIWSALCGFEPLPHETVDITQLRGVEKGVMKLVRRLLLRDPRLRPSPRQLLSERVFQARGNTTTQVSQGSNVSHGSAGSGR